MDINTVRGLATLIVLVAFVGICWWAYSPKRKKGFDEAAKLPFADEQAHDSTGEHADSSTDEAEQTK